MDKRLRVFKNLCYECYKDPIDINRLYTLTKASINLVEQGYSKEVLDQIEEDVLHELNETAIAAM